MNPGYRFSLNYARDSLETLETALQYVPAYRSWHCHNESHESNIDWRYAALPATTKKDIRENHPQSFVPDYLDIDAGLGRGDIEYEETSGTTSEKVTNIWNQKWWDASERSSWKLNSHTERIAQNNFREAILANPPNVGWVSDQTDLSMEERLLSRFLFLNEKSKPSLWSASHMRRMIRELKIFQPAILEADPVVLARLCRYIKNYGMEVYQPELIVLTYEYPTRLHLRQIREVFDVPITSSYGSTETGFVFMQCENRKFHQNSEFCRVDFDPLKTEHGGPLLGRILVTTFNNPWYYLLHFDVGDIVILDEKGKCSCGRESGLILSAIAGRVSNLTMTETGRLVTLHELDNTISFLEGIDEYRLDQRDMDHYHLQVVTCIQNKIKLEKDAVEILKALYGEKAEISVSFKAFISPEASGKYHLSSYPYPINIVSYLDEQLISPGSALS